MNFCEFPGASFAGILWVSACEAPVGPRTAALKYCLLAAAFSPQRTEEHAQVSGN
jgi:hypothetical protein